MWVNSVMRFQTKCHGKIFHLLSSRARLWCEDAKIRVGMTMSRSRTILMRLGVREQVAVSDPDVIGPLFGKQLKYHN